MREWNGQPDEWTDGNGMDEHIGGLVNEWGNGYAERIEGECVGCVGVGEIVGLRKRLGCCWRWLFVPSFFFLFFLFFAGCFSLPLSFLVMVLVWWVVEWFVKLFGGLGF